MEEKYYQTQESVEEYISMAEGFDGKELIDQLKHHLPTSSSLLEIGSGPGTDWEILKEFYDLTGSDNSLEFLKRLQSKYPEGEFVELDATNLKTEKKFDGIYSNKVLHHLQDHELTTSIARQFDILNPNGVICHSFWKGESSETFKGMFVNCHLKEELKKMFENNFHILVLEEYQEFEPNDSLLLIARKK